MSLRPAMDLAVLTLVLVSVAPTAHATSCSLRGGAQAQARCLMRPVLPGGRLDAATAELPVALRRLVGQRTNLARGRLRAHLRALRLGARALGGAVERRLPARVRYFVIHDTSSPFLGRQPFPANLDAERYAGNRLARWARDRRAHVYVTRAGQSITSRAFHVPLRATKRERRERSLRGRFLHVELVQPRRSARGGPRGNDRLAPTPGFSRPQLARLALLYVVASVRRGIWLIPAFHAALDMGLRGAHDDPQHFDLAAFAQLVGTLAESLSPRPPTR